MVVEEEKDFKLQLTIKRPHQQLTMSSSDVVRQPTYEYQDGLRAQLEYAADLNFLIPPFGRMSSML